MKNYRDLVVIIPALDPDEKMNVLVKELSASGFSNILLVDDGSSESCKHFFHEAKEEFGCRVYTHYVNMGKGRSLKDALNYVLNEYPNVQGVITADSDGQHAVEDIITCAELLLKRQDRKCLLLGARNFNEAGIPARSRFGNKTTSTVLNLFCGIRISDTQTGLRGITRTAMSEILTLKGERYEYEMNMIIESPELGVTIEEFPIQTIYIENNSTSHFNPILDSFRIYRQFFKYILSSLSSFLVDIILFNIFVNLLQQNNIAGYIVIATYGARLFSSIFNFTLNRNAVFQNHSGLLLVAGKYFALCIIQGTLSAASVSFLCWVLQMGSSTAVTICKIVVDTILFFISFCVQKKIVFKE